MAEITVVVPIYNSEKHINTCVHSIMNQSFRDIEILLINDGSTDRSREICEQIAKIDPRIVLYNKSNEGVSEARNFAISKASGKYITFVDADDEIEPSMLSELYKSIEQQKTDLAICGHRSLYYKNGELIRTINHNCPEFVGTTREFLLKIEHFLDSESIQGPCAKLFKTNIIKTNQIKFPPKQSFGEDTIFVYRYIKCCRTISSIIKHYYSYKKYNDESLSSIIRKDKFEIYLSLYEELKNLLLAFDIFNYESMLYKKICLAAIVSSNELLSPKCSFSNKEIKQIIRRIFLNKIVRISFKNSRNENLQYKILHLLTHFRMISCIFYLLKFKSYWIIFKRRL